jgi:manganese transport protein
MSVTTQRDLAQLCRDSFPKYISVMLWVIIEIAIAATDMAEVLGSAIALHLLFGIPIIAGVCITVLDVLLILFLHRGRIRIIEFLVFILISIITISFIIEMIYSKPVFIDVLQGFIPTKQLFTDFGMLYIAISILGATIMPHNLFLHSSLVLTRATRDTEEGRKEAIRYGIIDVIISLIGAFFVNASILIVAASAFYRNGYEEISTLEEAHQLLSPLLGEKSASILFGIALLASGQSATFTGTFAGQIVMEGFLSIRLPPVSRRLLTRLIAIIPAIIATTINENAVNDLLVLSQVILCFALPFAIFPLVLFTSDVHKMGTQVNSGYVKIIAYSVFVFITALDFFLIVLYGMDPSD